MNTRTRKFAAGLLLAATSSLFTPASRAQAAPKTPEPPPTNGPSPTSSSTSATTTGSNETEVMERFEVTGSYLPAAANSIAIPVIGLDSTAIEHSGNNNRATP